MYVVTGATGALGRLAVEALLERVPAEQVRATGRRVETLDDLAARGVDVRRADYDDPASLAAAFEGATRVLFVSGSDAGARLDQHRRRRRRPGRRGRRAGRLHQHPVRADLGHGPRAPSTRPPSGCSPTRACPTVLLRNGWYVENFLAGLATDLEHGMVGASGDGRFGAATRADYAEAAAVALTGGAAAGDVLELGGPGFTRAELAAEIARAAGREVTYTDLSVAGLTEALVAAGLPEGFAGVLADSDRGAAAGWLEAPGDDLARLLGRPATPWAEVVGAAVREVVAPV